MIDIAREIAAVQRETGTGRLGSSDARTVILRRTYAAPVDEVHVDHALHPERSSGGGHEGAPATRGDEQDGGEDLVHLLLDPGVRVGEEPDRELVEVARLLWVVADDSLPVEVLRRERTI